MKLNLTKTKVPLKILKVRLILENKNKDKGV